MAKADTDFFWTDAQQAQDRLARTCILYDDLPVYVSEITPGDDGVPRARILNCTDPNGKPERKVLNSPKFKRFRVLPSFGWMNSANPKQGALLLSRININTRQHGLNRNNVSVRNFYMQPGENINLSGGTYSFDTIMFDKGFVDAHCGKFPSLVGVLSNITESSAIAFSLKFCVMRDAEGIRWLYRKGDKIGIFTGVDTLNLFTKYSYLREEIMDDPLMTINNIREF